MVVGQGSQGSQGRTCEMESGRGLGLVGQGLLARRGRRDAAQGNPAAPGEVDLDVVDVGARVGAEVALGVDAEVAEALGMLGLAELGRHLAATALQMGTLCIRLQTSMCLCTHLPNPSARKQWISSRLTRDSPASG